MFIYTFISRFIKPAKDLSSPNQSPSTILKARPQVARNFITLVLVGNFTVISYFLVNIFAESGRLEFEPHRWDLSDHSPSETNARFDVLVKIFHQMRSWCKNAGLILITPLFPLQKGYLWNILEKLKLDQWKLGMNHFSLILLPFYKSQWTHTSTKKSKLQLRAASFKDSIIPSITSFGHAVASPHVLTFNETFQASCCSWLIKLNERK